MTRTVDRCLVAVFLAAVVVGAVVVLLVIVAAGLLPAFAVAWETSGHLAVLGGLWAVLHLTIRPRRT